jgi:DNA-binding response OmpR family regulator
MAAGEDRRKALKALCVVTDADTFELLRVQLRERGYEAQHVDAASAALAAARSGEYSLYILENWWLADGDGIGLCREIRLVDPGSPIVFYSSNALPSEISKAFEAGAEAYIPLPDISGELARKIEQLLDTAIGRTQASRGFLKAGTRARSPDTQSPETNRDAAGGGTDD